MFIDSRFKQKQKHTVANFRLHLFHAKPSDKFLVLDDACLKCYGNMSHLFFFYTRHCIIDDMVETRLNVEQILNEKLEVLKFTIASQTLL